MKHKLEVRSNQWARVKAVLLGLLFLCGAICSWAEEFETFKVTVIREPASIRNGSGERLLDLDKGNVLIVLQPAEGNTFKVQTDDLEPTVGYISCNLVRKVEEEVSREDRVQIESGAKEDDEKSWLARNWGWAAGGVALVAGGVALAAGGGGGGGGSDGGSGGGTSVTGNWVGRAGTGQLTTTMTLSQSGTGVSGRYTYSNGDSRSISGTINGNSLSMNTEAGSRWTMTLSADGNTLSGHAMKPDGDGYDLYFRRQ